MRKLCKANLSSSTFRPVGVSSHGYTNMSDSQLDYRYYNCTILTGLFPFFLVYPGPACIRFTPLLSVLHEAANEDEKLFEVVYVSSDHSAQECHDYMNRKHGDWLRVPFDSPLRNQLKDTFGVFAGKEQSQFPNTKRRSGIPTLVVVSKHGKELALLDCDSSTVIHQVETQGTAFLDQWEQLRW